MAARRALATARRPASRDAARRRGVLLLGAGLALLLALAFVAARQTSLFALQTIDVAGAPADLERSTRAALERFKGLSLVALDRGAVERAIEQLPAVADARIDRDFPHTLNVSITPERAVAVLRRERDAWLVARSGRILAALEPGQLRPLPRVWVSSQAGALEPGDVLPEAAGGAPVRVLAQLPLDFPKRVISARGTADDLVLVLDGKTEIRLGDDIGLDTKMAVAAEALLELDVQAGAPLAYLDVSLPTRPVGASESQLDTSA